MTAILFDTLEIATKLKAAGFTDEQTRVILDVQKLTSNQTLEQAKHDYHLDDIATKRDLKELELTLELKIAETKADLTRWIVGVGILQVTIITALLLKLATQL